MRRSHLVHPLPGRRRHLPPWLWNGFWVAVFIALSVAVLALTAY